MSETVAAAPMFVALAAIAVTLVLRERPRAQRYASVLAAAAYAAAVAALVWRVVLAPDAAGALTYQPGGWPAPVGITLVADALAAFMLAVAAVVAVASMAFSVRFVDPRNQRVFYHPLFHTLLLGVTGAFLTGDLFNLFVWFEVMLIASYVFVAFYGEATHTAAAFRYLVLNVVGSALLLLSVGGIYATTGTLNMADVSRRLADPAAHGVDPAPVVGLSGLLLATFALKAGLVPFQFWVPAAYRAAPLPVAAMLAGATKKVGIYAVVRVYFTVLGGAAVPTRGAVPGVDSPLSFLAPVLLAMAVASIAVGGLGAVSRERLDGILAYSSVGQVGFIAVPVAIAAATGDPALRRLGLAAALVYALHHALAKALLFLSTAAVRGATGTTRVAELGGLAGRSPLLGGAFFVGAVSLVGIPPLAGFFGKFLVFRTAVARFVATTGPVAAGVVVVLLAGAVLTIVYTTRAWTRCFWGTESERVATAIVDNGQLVVLAAVALLVVGVGLGFDPVYRFADAAAGAALDRGAYVEVVLGGDAT